MLEAAVFGNVADFFFLEIQKGGPEE